MACQSAKLTLLVCSRTRLCGSLSPGERVGVRGNGPYQHNQRFVTLEIRVMSRQGVCPSGQWQAGRLPHCWLGIG